MREDHGHHERGLRDPYGHHDRHGHHGHHGRHGHHGHGRHELSVITL